VFWPMLARVPEGVPPDYQERGYGETASGVRLPPNAIAFKAFMLQ
jgi:hypothetical protein